MVYYRSHNSKHLVNTSLVTWPEDLWLIAEARLSGGYAKGAFTNVTLATSLLSK